MEDEEAIRTLIAEVARLADGPDVEAYVLLFTPDAEWLLPGAERRGHEDLRAGALERRARGETGPGSMTRHEVEVVAVSVEGGRAAARSRWRFVGAVDRDPVVLRAGTYDDELVRVDGRWLLHRRRIAVD